MSGAPAGMRSAAPARFDERLIEQVRQRLVSSGARPTPSAIAAAVRDVAGVLGDTAVLEVVTALLPELAGAGALDPLLRDPTVTDVLVNGPSDVWVDRASGLERVPVTFPDESSVRRLAQRLAATAGRRLDDASPCVDARLASGVRLNAVLPPISPGGTCLSLRVPRRRGFSMDELIVAGTVTPPAAAWLRRMIEHRVAFLISGGTGTGKTTLLATLLSCVDPRERIVLVEDASELRPVHPHVVHLESRPPNLEGAGAVTLRDLVRQALRMRPDRLVVGEVRGGEVVELLAALNTGHDGGCGTLHANEPADVPARIEALAVAAGLGRDAVHSQVAAGVQAVVHLARDHTGRRRVASIGVVQRAESGLVRVAPAAYFTHDGPVEPAGAAILATLTGGAL